jgi:hypothetical protein
MYVCMYEVSRFTEAAFDYLRRKITFDVDVECQNMLSEHLIGFDIQMCFFLFTQASSQEKEKKLKTFSDSLFLFLSGKHTTHILLNSLM